MKVAIDNSALKSGHRVRGIGMMVGEQIQAIKRLSLPAQAGDREIKLYSIDFENTDLSKYDIVHYPYFFPYQLTLPAEKPTKKVIVTIQDLTHLVYPKHYPPGFRGKLNYYRQKKRLKNVDAIITISETSKKDIVKFLGMDPDKIHVVYLAAKKVFRGIEEVGEIEGVRKKYKLPEKFVLFVGDVNYNKNIPTLIKACELAKITLVMVGKQAKEIDELSSGIFHIEGPRDWYRFMFNKPHPELAHYNKIANLISDNNKLIRTGFISDIELNSILNLATVYCQPSLHEGYGLPVIEATAAGTPVVASNIGAHKEIAGSAAEYFNPKNTKDLAKKLTKVVGSKKLQKEMSEKGFRKAKEYSWEKTAKEIVKVYKLVNSF